MIGLIIATVCITLMVLSICGMLKNEGERASTHTEVQCILCKAWLSVRNYIQEPESILCPSCGRGLLLNQTAVIMKQVGPGEGQVS